MGILVLYYLVDYIRDHVENVVICQPIRGSEPDREIERVEVTVGPVVSDSCQVDRKVEQIIYRSYS